MRKCKECNKEDSQKGSAFCKECNDAKYLFWREEIRNQGMAKECENLIKEYKIAQNNKRV